MLERLTGWQQALIIGLALGALRVGSLLAGGAVWSTIGAIAEVTVYLAAAITVWAVGRLWKRLGLRNR